MGDKMKISKYYRALLRFPLNIKNRFLLKNDKFTIISSNCVGGVYHELKVKFYSPTINLWFEAEDYLKFIESFEHYINEELIEIETDKNYPVGKLDDVTIYFMHYDSFVEAKTKWRERCKRINYDNLFFIMTASCDMPDDIIYRFDSLLKSNKVILTEKYYPNLKSAFQIRMSRKENEIYDLCKYKSKLSGKRYLDKFDYVKFLNRNIQD